ncbi:GIDE domain-containing protein [Halothiobacillus sp. DCM-1]|uniref:GIDE domain-containing protein n=1 Tax=Halothiobacillus sp. DCM-1 TaxID=3112558 RepID=UPI00325589C1
MAAYQQWLNTLTPNEYHGWLFGLLVVLLGVLGAGIYWLRQSAWIRNTPTARIASASQGYVEIEGTAELDADQPLASPLTATPCVWFSVQVDQRNSEGKKGWQRIYHAVSDALITVRDATGGCYLDPDHATVTTVSTRVWYGDTERPIVSAGVSSSGWFTGSYRYTERLLHPGEAIYALGWFQTIEHDPAIVEQDSVRALLAAWKQDPEKMRAFDTNRDGQISAEEWEAARQAAVTQVAAAQREARPPAQTHLMNYRAGMGRPYLISALDQTALARRYGRWGLVLFASSLPLFFLLITAYYLRTA